MERLEFKPNWAIRHPMIQTLLAGNSLRVIGGRPFVNAAKWEVLEQPDGLKTTAYINSHPNPKAAIILLHGWLGTPQSNYMVSAGKALYDAGLTTIRLTLPEHGEAAWMNNSITPITRVDVIIESVKAAQKLFPELALGVVGFSMGGNCALRIAREQAHNPIDNLAKVVAISPVIDSKHSCVEIDSKPLIQRYFLKKFRALYSEKLVRFPELSGMRSVLSQRTVMDITAAFADTLPEFDSLNDYFAGYSIGQHDLAECIVPVSTLSSVDDPILDIAPLEQLAVSSKVRRSTVPFGGHNGFVRALGQTAFCDAFTVAQFEGIQGA